MVWTYPLGLIVLLLLALFVVWAYPASEKGHKENLGDFKKKIINWKKHYIRTFLSIVAIWFLGGYIVTYGKEAVNQTYNNIMASFYSPPVITYSGGTIDLGTGNMFELTFETKKADNVSVNGVTIIPKNKIYYYSGNTVNLQTGMTIEITASNKYKSSQKQVAIVRNLTQKEEEELQMRIAKEMEEKEAELAKQREEEKEKELLGIKREQTRKKIEAKYIRLMERGGYVYEIEIKLYDLGFEQTAQGYGEAYNGSNQVISYYAKDEEGFRVVISIQNGYAVGKYTYKVAVKE